MRRAVALLLGALLLSCGERDRRCSACIDKCGPGEEGMHCYVACWYSKECAPERAEDGVDGVDLE